MKENDFKKIAESLIDVFNLAGNESISLFKKGLKIEIKSDNSPVSNRDLKVNQLICDKIKILHPNVKITIDPIENRGFNYYSGIGFEAHHNGWHKQQMSPDPIPDHECRLQNVR